MVERGKVGGGEKVGFVAGRMVADERRRREVTERRDERDATEDEDDRRLRFRSAAAWTNSSSVVSSSLTALDESGSLESPPVARVASSSASSRCSHDLSSRSTWFLVQDELTITSSAWRRQSEYISRKRT